MGLSIKEFISKHKGTAVDVPWDNGHWKGECVSLAQIYINEVAGLPLFKSNGRPYARGNGIDFGNTLIKDGDAIRVTAPQYGDLVIWGGFSGYGHVAVYIDKNTVFDQTTGQRKNAQLRTPLPNIIQYVRVKATIKPDASNGLLVKQDGKFTVTFADGLNVRKGPSVNSERVTGLSRGQSVIYDNYIDAEGYRWVSWIHEGTRVYGARRKLDNSEIYGDAEFLSKEPSRPVSDVGKTWTPKSFPLKLYPQSTGGTNYGDSNGKRTYTILSDANGRVQIQHKLFDAPQNKVWVNKSDGKVG